MLPLRAPILACAKIRLRIGGRCGLDALGLSLVKGAVSWSRTGGWIPARET